MVNVEANKSSFSFPFSPPPPPPTGGREKGKEKLDFAARTLSPNKQYLHSSHQICVEKYYSMLLKEESNFIPSNKYLSKTQKFN